MSARLLEGKHIAAALRKEIKAEVEELMRLGIVPGLTMIRVGQDPASITYMNAKAKSSEEVGVRSAIVELPRDCREEQIATLLGEIGRDTSIHGVIVQLPLPPHLDVLRVLSLMNPEKDVDGFHPINVGRLSMGEPLFVPATPMGIKELLDRSDVSVEGAHVVIVGRSMIVGKPLANYLSLKKPGLNATVTLCHSSSTNLEKITRSADILVSAVGRAEFVRASMVSPGAVVVDVGMNRIDDPSTPTGNRLVGDVKFDEVSEIASAITPVPGGVGPMTVAMLLRNTVEACRMQTGDRNEHVR
ncbi:MAG: bifunctional 5,10-methylene-tetrahydrofolate dehydrogenase/5,10-methylene-tetrahydrofolate cyclohydrolase [Candidatus Eisenbacteria bacterium]|nr:bifunctional 5,10-methylene-tetrahydrofolate dehydrogenase/5,10-methylene-tetrahydrofolate cyclohydrolase [Candidatus Eisenbacteria bacterium]